MITIRQVNHMLRVVQNVTGVPLQLQRWSPNGRPRNQLMSEDGRNLSRALSTREMYDALMCIYLVAMEMKKRDTIPT